MSLLLSSLLLLEASSSLSSSRWCLEATAISVRDPSSGVDYIAASDRVDVTAAFVPPTDAGRGFPPTESAIVVSINVLVQIKHTIVLNCEWKCFDCERGSEEWSEGKQMLGLGNDCGVGRPEDAKDAQGPSNGPASPQPETRALRLRVRSKIGASDVDLLILARHPDLQEWPGNAVPQYDVFPLLACMSEQSSCCASRNSSFRSSIVRRSWCTIIRSNLPSNCATLMRTLCSKWSDLRQKHRMPSLTSSVSSEITSR